MAEAKSGELSVALKPNRELSQEMGRHRTLWQDAVRRFMRNRLAVFGLVIVVFLLFLAIFADLIAPFPYDKADFSKVRLLPMRDPAHPLGTDEVGRDYLSRLIYGARTSMT
ncbi:peptide ABC transporter permease, partial [Litorilinea aerophila]